MCTCPLPARRVGGRIEFLGRSLEGRFFSSPLATLQIPCGQCAECRLKRSREWAIRCTHEASLHADNCFLTLTYRDDERAVSLDYGDFQAFMKRLRARFSRDKIMFFACGEYGETNPATGVKDGGKYRAHFHAILFGFNFPDRVPCRMLGRSDLEKSVLLDELWRFGDCKIGKVTFESAAYVARYAMKKVNGDLAKSVYTVITPTGEMIERVPEMLVMSKRPAIGKVWFEKFGKGVYYRDKVVARGVEMQPPRYYDKLLPEVVRGMVSRRRAELGEVSRKDHTDARNNVRNLVVTAGLKQVERD
ncbi:MAG: replication initiator protein [Microvirus sp.]|nr:MAG: replication initiator protein [Microvirus sp.]